MSTKKTKVESKLIKAVAIKKNVRVIKVAPSVELISFEITATIPVQSFGNIIPKIVVKAPTIEDARAIVMPIIEDLYQTYAEMPSNGRLPKFYNKANVEVTERRVEAPVTTGATGKAPVANVVPLPAIEQKAPAKAPVPAYQQTPVNPTYEGFCKAENAIASAVSLDALKLIENQVKISLKINEEDKPILFTMILKKRPLIA